MAATWRLKGGRGEPKVAQKSTLEGVGDRLVSVLGASGGTRRVLLLKGVSQTNWTQIRASPKTIYTQGQGIDLLEQIYIYIYILYVHSSNVLRFVRMLDAFAFLTQS